MRTLRDPRHFSTLKNMARSPAHYLSSVLEPREPTAPMRFGNICHSILFRQPHIVWPKQRRGKDWEAFEASRPANDTRLVITQDEYDRARRVCDAIGANPDATRVLVGQHEVERTWSMLCTPCAGRLDVLGDRYVTEFKTTTNSHPATFMRGAMRLGYHAQLPWYIDGVGQPDWDAYIVAVEVAPPYAVTVFQLSPRVLQEGRKLYRLWMEQLLVCESTNDWPAYCQSVVPFDMPDYDQPLIIDGEEVEAA